MAKPLPAVPCLALPFAFPPEASAVLALDPRGARLAVAWEDADAVRVFDVRDGREVAHCTGFRRVRGVQLLSASTLLVTAADGCFRCDLDRDRRGVLSSEARAIDAPVSPDGLLALGAPAGLDLHDADTGRLVRRLRTNLAGFGSEPAWGRHAAFSARGRYVAAALSSAYPAWYIVVVWETQTGRRQRVFDTLAHALAFRGDTLNLALADDWGHIDTYAPDQGEEPLVRFKVEYLAQALRFEARGKTLALLLDRGRVFRFDAATGRVIERQEPPAGDGLRTAVVSADWSNFAAATADGVVVWRGGRQAVTSPRSRTPHGSRCGRP